MTDSVWIGSVVIGGEVAAGCVELAGFPELPVVPDTGRESEDALADACPDAVGGVPAVLFEGELSLERVVDRFDPLADPAERAEALALARAVGANELGVEAGDGVLELVAGEALVGDEDLAAREQFAGPGALEHRRGDLALGLVRGRQAEG